MLRVGIIGASGYTGAELARILATHPEAKITVATSRQYAGQKLSEVFPSLRERVDITCENLSTADLLERADFFFAAVPHKTAMEVVPTLLQGGKKVVDLSADFRLRDVAVYEQWYQEHSAADLLKDAVYGLSELYREQIQKTDLVANPGCYPTSIVLALAPLLREKLIDPASIIIDAKSGASGAGRAANVATLFCEVTEGFRPYKVGGTHRHTPEIDQELSALAGTPLQVTFTPHLLPNARGILSTIYAAPNAAVTEKELHELYTRTYDAEPFVRVCPLGAIPATQYVRGSNCCDIGISVDQRTGRIIMMSAIDNVMKGASGQAIQNMNLMTGLPETIGLMGAPYFP